MQQHAWGCCCACQPVRQGPEVQERADCQCVCRQAPKRRLQPHLYPQEQRLPLGHQVPPCLHVCALSCTACCLLAVHFLTEHLACTHSGNSNMQLLAAVAGAKAPPPAPPPPPGGRRAAAAPPAPPLPPLQAAAPPSVPAQPLANGHAESKGRVPATKAPPAAQPLPPKPPGAPQFSHASRHDVLSTRLRLCMRQL